jgi:hypothetical protein
MIKNIKITWLFNYWKSIFIFIVQWQNFDYLMVLFLFHFKMMCLILLIIWWTNVREIDFSSSNFFLDECYSERNSQTFYKEKINKQSHKIFFVIESYFKLKNHRKLKVLKWNEMKWKWKWKNKSEWNFDIGN